VTEPITPTTFTAGVNVKAERRGRVYARGVLLDVYEAQAGVMAQIDEGKVSNGLRCTTIVPADEVTAVDR
jgi:hypothetical protein